MNLVKVKLRDVIAGYNQSCGISNLTVDDVSGINKDKEFFEPSKQIGSDTSNYKEVPNGFFACNLMHVGRDCVLPVALNHSGKVKYVSPAYSIFSLNKNSGILPMYLFMFLKSAEKDRFFWFHTDSSVRDGMSWSDFCEIEINMPSIEIQQKYVDLYKAILTNQQTYEESFLSIKQAYELCLHNLKQTITSERIGSYIELLQNKNEDLTLGLSSVKGISVDKEFIETKANMDGVNLSKYLVINPGAFAYVPDTSRRGDKIGLALNDSDDPILCSSIYTAFKCKDPNILDPQYLMLFFAQDEFNRYARFHSWGSARETFDWDAMCEVKIPIPPIEKQRAIANIYKVYRQRKEINQQLKDLLRRICPVLIKGSIEEARKT